jgi:hypothetical protein
LSLERRRHRHPCSDERGHLGDNEMAAAAADADLSMATEEVGCAA